MDAYFVHWPFPNYHAPGCDGDSRNPDSRPFSADEFLGVWRELEGLYDQGLARHLGMSNMTVSKLEAVLPQCRVKPSMIEMELHPSFQQEELFDYCVLKGIQVIGFCPLGSPNRPERDRTPEDVADTELNEVVWKSPRRTASTRRSPASSGRWPRARSRSRSPAARRTSKRTSLRFRTTR